MRTHRSQYSLFAFCVFAAATAVFAAPPSGAQAEKKAETIQQLLARAAFIGIAKVEGGVLKGEDDQPLWRIVTIEKTLLDRTKDQVGVLPTWYAPLEDLGTDDYCILIGVEIKGTTWAVPPSPGENLDEDRLKYRTNSSEDGQLLHRVETFIRVMHSATRWPSLKEALANGYILADGQKVPVKDLVALARTPQPGAADPPRKIEQVEDADAE